MTDEENSPDNQGPKSANIPVELDTRRGMAAQKATVERRLDRGSERFAEAEARRRLDELEDLANAPPAESWAEASRRAADLIRRFADTPAGQDPRCKAAIARTLADLSRFGSGSDTPQDPLP